MKVMYIRCSTAEQNESAQIELSKQIGAEKCFIDKASGKTPDNRPQLNAMLDYVREGDIVVCRDITRIARNVRDLLNIVDTLNNKGVEFVSIKENIDTTTPQGKFMLSVFGAMAELERECILQKTREGIELAKAQGKYKGRKALDLDTDEFRRYAKDWREGRRTAVECMKHFNISSPTWYRKIKEYNL